MMRQFGLLGVVVFVIGLGPAADAHAQSEDSTSAHRRTPWGDPDLQGMWPSGSLIMVPFERAEELGTRAEFTAEEHEQRIAAIQQRVHQTDHRAQSRV